MILTEILWAYHTPSDIISKVCWLCYFPFGLLLFGLLCLLHLLVFIACLYYRLPCVATCLCYLLPCITLGPLGKHLVLKVIVLAQG